MQPCARARRLIIAEFGRVVPLQMAGYGAGQLGVGGMAPQGYGYSAQQYGNYPPQFNNYSSHPGNSYAYGGQSGYQPAGYGAAGSGYAQGNKYGRGGYAAAGESSEFHAAATHPGTENLGRLLLPD